MGVFSVLFSHGLSDYRYNKRQREREMARREREMAALNARRTTVSVTDAREKALRKALGPELIAEVRRRGITVMPSFTGHDEVYVDYPCRDSITGKEIVIVPMAAITRRLESVMKKLDEPATESRAERAQALKAAQYEEWRSAELARFAGMRADIESLYLPPGERTKRLEALQRVEYQTLQNPPPRLQPSPLDKYL
jgi:hypothetical protein